MDATPTSAESTLIGRWAVIPATMPYDRTVHDLRLDLTDQYCLRFETTGLSFAVDRGAMQALLDGYDDMQARIRDES